MAKWIARALCIFFGGLVGCERASSSGKDGGATLPVAAAAEEEPAAAPSAPAPAKEPASAPAKEPVPSAPAPDAAYLAKAFPVAEDECPMWGRTPARNMVHPAGKNIPSSWDLKTGRNLLWSAKLGSQYGLALLCDS